MTTDSNFLFMETVLSFILKYIYVNKKDDSMQRNLR